MTEHNPRPTCDHVYNNEEGTKSFEKPAVNGDDPDEFIRCTKHSIVSFTLDGTRYHGCGHHAPEEAVEALDLPFPRERSRKDTISV